MRQVKEQRAFAYKVGFLRKLAEVGMTPPQWHAYIKKAFLDPGSMALDALRGASGVGEKSLGAGAELLSGGAGLAGQAALYGPLAFGAVTGAAEAALNAPSPEDIENVRREELIALYRRMTDEISARRSRKAAME